MRRSLVWLLAAASALSGLALWLPQRASTIVAAIEERRAVPLPGTVTDDGRASPARPLPSNLEPLVVEPARHNPFGEMAAPAPPKPPPVAAAPAPPPAAPALAPPPMNWRLLGTMETPTGERLVMLTQQGGQHSVLATPGAVLEGDYEVVTVQTDAVRVVHRLTQTEVVIPIPPPRVSGR
jgi:hypothetical protein